MTEALARLAAIKSKQDSEDKARENYSAYVADRIECGWSEEDVAEYRAEVKRIMESGTADEKAAAREFWAHKAKTKLDAIAGINDRIRASIQAEKREAA